MADDRWTTWQAEQAGTNRGPTGAGVLFLAVLAVLVALVLQLAPTTHGGQAVERDQGSLCDQHRADPAWTSICREASRGR